MGHPAVSDKSILNLSLEIRKRRILIGESREAVADRPVGDETAHMVQRKNPTAKRRVVAAALKEFRERLGLKPAEVAKRVNHDASWLARIERAEIRAHPDAVTRLLDLYQVTGAQADAVLDLAASAGSRGWWHVYTRAMPEWFGKFIGLEGAASIIRNFENGVMPGLLQTEDYARAVMQAVPLPGQPTDIDRFVKLRMERQELLTAEQPPQLRFILDESVVRRPIGGPDVLRNQLERILDLTAEHLHIKVMILPFDAGAHAGVDGPFILLDFPAAPAGLPDTSDPRVVYIDNLVSALYLEESDQVMRYSAAWDSLCNQALSTNDSRELMRKLAEDL
ncbi:helix-turn-helix transcriptional regulator [Actinocatenispora sera]|uniref:helix-turn-helix domain-containing protein n=1 Tax=Actinocatenispora sera TaxID=390989 RepID=UPI0033C4C59A